MAFAVPFGGLLRAELAAGETLIVNGASGDFGSAAVLLGVALGASRIVALGRDRKALEEVARLAALVASGQLDLEALRVQAFALHELERAIEAAAAMVGLHPRSVTGSRKWSRSGRRE